MSDPDNTNNVRAIDGQVYQLRRGAFCLSGDPSSRAVTMDDCTKSNTAWQYKDADKSWQLYSNATTPAAKPGLFLSAPNNGCDVALALDTSASDTTNLSFDATKGQFQKTDCNDGCIAAAINYKGYVPHMDKCSSDDTSKWRLVQEQVPKSTNPYATLIAPVLALAIVGFIILLIRRNVRRQQMREEQRETVIQQYLQQLAQQ